MKDALIGEDLESRGGPRPMTLFLSTSNGAGVGHITRLMAAARRLPQEVRVVFVTQSLGAPLVEQLGFAVEYVASNQAAQLDFDGWNAYLLQRYSHLLELYEPDAVVYDGVAPYRGMTAAFERAQVPAAWLRRALWKSGRGQAFIELGAEFDLVIEPGEIEEQLDLGATSQDVARTLSLPPVTYLDADEVLDADEAQHEICGDRHDRLVLVSLGAGNINDTSSDVSHVIRRLHAMDYEPVIAVSPIAASVPEVPGVRVVQTYPVSRLLHGFAFVVTAAGYNSVHELVMSASPGLVIPNEATGLDDQQNRALTLERLGGCIAARQPAEIETGLSLLAQPDVRSQMRLRLVSLRRPNGATPLARALLGMPALHCGGK